MPLKVDKTTNPLSYNPSTGVMVSQVFSPGNGTNIFSALSTTGLEVTNASSARTIINSGQITCATTQTGTPPTTTITPTSITCSSLGATSTTTITPTSLSTTSLSTTSLSTSLLTTTSQLTLSNSLSTATVSDTGVLNCDFNDFSTGIFSVTLTTSDIVGINFSGGRTGGQYVIYVSNSNFNNNSRTIASRLTGTANRTNYTTGITVTVYTTAVLTVTFNRERYLISGSAFNGATPTLINSFANFVYQTEDGNNQTRLDGNVSILPDGKTYQILVTRVFPDGATYAIVAEGRATTVGQTANIVVVGTGIYDGTAISPNLRIVAPTTAIFEYSSNNGSTWTTMPAGGISIVANGTTHQLRVKPLSILPQGATYTISPASGTASANTAGQSISISIARTDVSQTLTSPTLRIVSPLITGATFEYSNDNGANWTPISSNISILSDGKTYQLRVASTVPSEATYTINATTATTVGQTASMSIVGNGSYSGTITSPTIQIVNSISIASATFQYSSNGSPWTNFPTNPPKNTIQVLHNGSTYQLRVASVLPSGATYTTTTTSPQAIDVGEKGTISITGNGIYTGTFTSPILLIKTNPQAE